jgi:hypothetical protein
MDLESNKILNKSVDYLINIASGSSSTYPNPSVLEITFTGSNKHRCNLHE